MSYMNNVVLERPYASIAASVSNASIAASVPNRPRGRTISLSVNPRPVYKSAKNVVSESQPMSVHPLPVTTDPSKAVLYVFTGSMALAVLGVLILAYASISERLNVLTVSFVLIAFGLLGMAVTVKHGQDNI